MPARWARRRSARPRPSYPKLALPQPEIGGVGVAVVSAQVEIATEGTGDGRSDEYDSASSAFAAADGDRTGYEVDVIGLQGEEAVGNSPST